MSYDITPIVQAFIALCAVVITSVVIPWVKAKYSNESVSEFLVWVDIAVRAAEQIYDSTDGAEKKKYVLNLLDEHGYVIDGEQVDSAIEAAVLDLHSALYGESYEGSKE